MIWYSHLKNFPQLIVIHTVKRFGIVNKAEIDDFLEFPCFLCNPVDVGSLISGSSVFSKPRLNIWKFSIQVILKLTLKDFEHNPASMGDERNSLVVWTFFSTAPFGNLDVDRPFPVL